MLARDGMQLFRASSATARLDWVCALATVSTAHELGIWVPPSRPPEGDATDSASPAASSGAQDAGGGGGGESVARPDVAVDRAGWRFGFRRASPSRGASGDDGAREGSATLEGSVEENSDDSWQPGETEAVGGRSAAGDQAAGTRSTSGAVPRPLAAPRRVMHGFLKKRGVSRLWGVHEEWSYRWVVLRVRRSLRGSGWVVWTRFACVGGVGCLVHCVAAIEDSA